MEFLLLKLLFLGCFFIGKISESEGKRWKLDLGILIFFLVFEIV